MNSNHELHKELWFWLAENTGEVKDNWPMWSVIRAAPSYCFACKEACIDGLYCHRRCPISWNPIGGHCTSKNTIYYAWERELDLEKRSIMAEVIATKTWHKRRNK